MALTGLALDRFMLNIIFNYNQFFFFQVPPPVQTN